MAFTSWSALRTAMLDAYADHVATGNWIGEYTQGARTLRYKSEKEFFEAIEKTYVLEGLETSGSISSRVSYGRHRRF